jgi:signal transduction histidine kinase
MGEFSVDELSKKELEGFLKTSIDSSDIISRNLERAHELIKSFKQLAMDQSTTENRIFDVGRYVRDIVRSLGPEFKGFQVESNVDCDESIRIDAPAGLLAQVVTNLVMNSLIHGFADSKAGNIHIGIRRSGELLHITYIDNGCGMDPATLKHLFEPFFTTRRGQGGSGLGMNIVYNIVTQHFRGSIRVDSERGQGVRYDMRLPVTFV